MLWGKDKRKEKDEPQSLDEWLKCHIERFGSEAKKHKRLHRELHLAVIVLTMATTILAGFGLSYPAFQHETQFGLIVLTASTTAVAGYAALRRAGDVWKIERTIHHRLQDLNIEMTWLRSVGKWDEDNQKRILDGLVALLGSSSEEWRSRIVTSGPPTSSQTAQSNPSDVRAT